MQELVAPTTSYCAERLGVSITPEETITQMAEGKESLLRTEARLMKAVGIVVAREKEGKKSKSKSAELDERALFQVIQGGCSNIVISDNPEHRFRFSKNKKTLFIPAEMTVACMAEGLHGLLRPKEDSQLIVSPVTPGIPVGAFGFEPATLDILASDEAQAYKPREVRDFMPIRLEKKLAPVIAELGNEHPALVRELSFQAIQAEATRFLGENRGFIKVLAGSTTMPEKDRKLIDALLLKAELACLDISNIGEEDRIKNLNAEAKTLQELKTQVVPNLPIKKAADLLALGTAFHLWSMPTEVQTVFRKFDQHLKDNFVSRRNGLTPDTLEGGVPTFAYTQVARRERLHDFTTGDLEKTTPLTEHKQTIDKILTGEITQRELTHLHGLAQVAMRGKDSKEIMAIIKQEIEARTFFTEMESLAWTLILTEIKTQSNEQVVDDLIAGIKTKEKKETQDEAKKLRTPISLLAHFLHQLSFITYPTTTELTAEDRMKLVKAQFGQSYEVLYESDHWTATPRAEADIALQKPEKIKKTLEEKFKRIDNQLKGKLFRALKLRTKEGRSERIKLIQLLKATGDANLRLQAEVLELQLRINEGVIDGEMQVSCVPLIERRDKIAKGTDLSVDHGYGLIQRLKGIINPESLKEMINRVEEKVHEIPVLERARTMTHVRVMAEALYEILESKVEARIVKQKEKAEKTEKTNGKLTDSQYLAAYANRFDDLFEVIQQLSEVIKQEQAEPEPDLKVDVKELLKEGFKLGKKGEELSLFGLLTEGVEIAMAVATAKSATPLIIAKKVVGEVLIRQGAATITKAIKTYLTKKVKK